MMYVAQNGLSMNTKRQSSRVASSPVSSIVKNLINSFNTVSSELHFGFRSLKYGHGNYKLFADRYEIYPILFKICVWIQHAQHFADFQYM